MRSLVLAALVVVSVSAVKSLAEPHRVDKKESIEQEISEALKDINTSRNIIHMTIQGNDTDKLPAGFFRELEDVFGGMFEAIQNTHVPFFSEDYPEDHETTAATNQTTEKDLLTRTRNELKHDIDGLRSHIAYIQSDFNDWALSNEHREFRAMLLGVMSAVTVLAAFFVIRSCCRRRSRLNHLAAFANDGFTGNRGDTESLLPTTAKPNKRNRHYPSNSDEDI